MPDILFYSEYFYDVSLIFGEFSKKWTFPKFRSLVLTRLDEVSTWSSYVLLFSTIYLSMVKIWAKSEKLSGIVHFKVRLLQISSLKRSNRKDRI